MPLRRGSKDPDSTAGAPYPPATEHSDGPDDRPRRDVPTARESDEDEPEREEESDGP